MKPVISILTAAFLLAPTAAFAHPGHAADGVLSGLIHPVTGPDHLLAMVAVGVLAGLMGTRALWLVPGSFLIMAAFGGWLGSQGLQSPAIEFIAAASVVALGVAIALRNRLPLAVAAGLSGAFGFCHGVAHGLEIPATATGLEFGIGFMIATAMLHLFGVCVGLGINDLSSRPAVRVVRAGGVAMALVGAVLLVRGF